MADIQKAGLSGARARAHEIIYESDTRAGRVFDVALIVGGSITIPHVRRAYGRFAELGWLEAEES